MIFPELAKEIIALRDADEQLRQQIVNAGELGPLYHPDMEALHIKNAERLQEIIDEIGFPSSEKVGKDASDAAWLVIQHAISRPSIMKSYASLLKSEISLDEEKWHPHMQDLQLAIYYAYLSDRIAVLADQPQHYGTQHDWDKDGYMSPQPSIAPDLVRENRKRLDLRPIEEQTRTLRQQAAQEERLAPEEYEKRMEAYDEWRRSVGWTN